MEFTVYYAKKMVSVFRRWFICTCTCLERDLGDHMKVLIKGVFGADELDILYIFISYL